MPVLVASTRASSAQAAATVVAAPGSNSRILPRAIHLSVPAGQNAQLSIGALQIASTESSYNMVLGEELEIQGALNAALTVTSSGAVSYTVFYNTSAVLTG